ncbi:MAG: glycosyltransferase [Thermoleophilia bacterium]
MGLGADARTELPACTVVIPTRDRPRMLAVCLESIARSDYPLDRLDVVVVDDGAAGDARPAGAVDTVRDRLDVSLLETNGRGPSAARNLGASRARGNVLLFTDDDCRVDAQWLRTLSQAIQSAPKIAAGGRIVNQFADNRWSAASQRVLDIVYSYYNADPARATFLASNNLAVPADAFRELGGFDEEFRWAEDRDFCRRWLAAGHELIYVPAAVVEHAHRLTPQAYVRQQFSYGRGAFHFHRTAAREGDSQADRARGFYSDAARRLVRKEGFGEGKQIAHAAVEIGGWQLANAAGFAWEAVRARVGR